MSRMNNKQHYEEEACITMHQPWASLLVHGIKRIEGRSWPSPITGRLWIHAASKVPDAQTIRAMEEFYQEIYAVDGITSLTFPDNYPGSRLLGCVEVVGCLKRDELAYWKSVSRGVRLEALTNFCWLCEHPQKLSEPLKMRGDQGVYNLEKKIINVALNSLIPIESPFLVKFPLPLTPGSLRIQKTDSENSDHENPRSLIAAIAGAQAAATQYTKKNQSTPNHTFFNKDVIQTETLNKLYGISLNTLPQKDVIRREIPNKQSTFTPEVNIRREIPNKEHTSTPEVNIRREIPNKQNSFTPEVNRRKTDTRVVNNNVGKGRYVYVPKKKEESGLNSSENSDKSLGGPSQIFSSALNGIRQSR